MYNETTQVNMIISFQINIELLRNAYHVIYACNGRNVKFIKDQKLLLVIRDMGLFKIYQIIFYNADTTVFVQHYMHTHLDLYDRILVLEVCD